MSNYTTKIKDLCEAKIPGRDNVEQLFKSYELTDYLSPKQIESINNLGIWSKDKLAKKIVDHYYMREIGFETYGLFAHYVKTFMQEIMEDYLPVVYSNSIEFDPLVNVDFTETFNRTNSGESQNNGESTTNSNSSSNGNNIYSNTPNAALNIQNIKDGKYATDVNFTESGTQTQSNINDTASSRVSNTEEYTKKTKGNSGVTATAQAMIKQYRDIIRAVDREIIERLDILFMGIY